MNKYIESIKQRVKNLPLNPGVYIMRDEAGTIIYIGKAKHLKNRVSQYFLNTQKQHKVQLMADSVKTFDYIITNSELEALNLEANLIKKHQPFYNILLKDGKAHPFLKIDLKQDFPVVEITRKLKKDGAKYFGPYFGAVNAKDLLHLINTTFSLKTCHLNLNNGKQAKRECLNYHMGLCYAPCVGKISKQNYRKEIDKVIAFLNGDVSYAKQMLQEKMQLCAETENFEKAIVYRNNLNLVNNLSSKLITELNSFADIDVFGYFTNGVATVISVLVVRAGKIMGLNNFNVVDLTNNMEENLTNFISQYYPSNSYPPAEIVLPVNLGEVVENFVNQFGKKVKITIPKIGVRKKLLTMAEVNAHEYLEKNIEKEKLNELKTIGAVKLLQKHLNLPELPMRIEGFDISNISGTNMVASMVVFTNGSPNYAHYRKFKIKTVVGQNNDFECMREVLTRRINELKTSSDVSFSTRPNLILIDGGKGQLSFAYSVLTDSGINIPMISLAEKFEEVFKPGVSESVVLSRDDYALKLLQRVRDESHRFAITFHRNLRNKNMLVSELSKINLIGKTKEMALLSHFRDINKIKNASIEELMEVDGISKKLAQNIYDYFHKN
ncbi:MAG: excinuclease ABC subunit UvrC [Clostridia bacterium]|nr:excinuclease ABC subunit UvrC [Clostridia bacterium]